MLHVPVVAPRHVHALVDSQAWGAHMEAGRTRMAPRCCRCCCTLCVWRGVMQLLCASCCGRVRVGVQSRYAGTGHTAGNCLMRTGGGARPLFTCLKRRWRRLWLRWGGWRLWNPTLPSTPVSTPPCARFKS